MERRKMKDWGRVSVRPGEVGSKEREESKVRTV